MTPKTDNQHHDVFDVLDPASFSDVDIIIFLASPSLSSSDANRLTDILLNRGQSQSEIDKQIKAQKEIDQEEAEWEAKWLPYKNWPDEEKREFSRIKLQGRGYARRPIWTGLWVLCLLGLAKTNWCWIGIISFPILMLLHELMVAAAIEYAVLGNKRFETQARKEGWWE